MATIKFTYGDVQDHTTYVGEENTISVDTEKKTLRVHDGVTPGGSALATEEQLEVFVNRDTEIVAGDGLTGGGFLDGNQVNVSLGTPSTITGSTINESSANSHSHAISLNKNDVGLSNVDNTSDLNKPISTATQTALNAKAPLASPVFTGNPEVPTQLTSDNSKKVANTEFVKAVVDARDVGVTSVSGTAPINVSGGTSTPTVSITPATQSSAGSMSAADKSKLDGIQAGAEQNTVDSVAGKTGVVVLSASDIGGLGTAATANLTTSEFDTTAGRVLKNGDWGIPTDINMWTTPHVNVGGDTGTDLNTLTTAGWWRKLISPSSINRPSGGSGYWYLLVLKYVTGTNVTQVAFPYGTGTNGNIQYRSQYDGIWGAWRTLYDSNNLSLTSSNTDGTAGRVTQVGDFGLGASGDGVRVSGDIDNPDLLLAGFYSILPPNTLGTFPAGWGSFGGTLLVETFRVGSGTRFVKQTLTGNGSLGNKVYFRLYNGNTSTWSNWLEFLHLGNQLDIGTTATSARAALGLGTAAVGTLTESATDDIVGKVLKVGDFGIGSNAVTLTGVDMNTVVRTGFYIITSPVNGPAGTTTNLLVLGNTSGSGRTMQIAHPVNGEAYYVRSQSAGTWSTWKQFYHSGNLLNIGTTAATARTALGLATGATTTVGTLATQNSNSVSITGGSIAGITDLAIADGGTGASTAAGARSNLGLGTAAVANVTTSNNDTTADRLMKTGDFGLGTGQMAVTDCDSAILTGFYVTSGSAANKPAGAGASVWMAVFGNGSSVVHQYCYDPTTSEVYYRRLSSSVWSGWRKFFHAGNQLNLGTTVTSARTALGLGTAATKNVGTSSGDVVEVGAFGLGYAKQVTNYAERIDSGFYLSAGTSEGQPTGMVADGGWMINLNWAFNNAGNRYNCAFYGNVQNNFIGFRRINQHGEPQDPVEIYHSGNISSVSIAATQLSGTIPDARLSGTYTGVNITGNAATATKLATARTINGVNFDGSANITVDDSTKLPLTGGTLTGTLTGTRARFTGTGNDFGSGGLEVIGNGSANTVFPTIGFHQPGLWASSIQLRGASDFRFYAQGGTAYANVTAARFYGDSSQMSVATTSANGVMSAADKAKLDSLSTTAGISEDDAIVLALIFG